MIGLLLPRETQFFDLLCTSAQEVLEHAELSHRFITAGAPELEQRIHGDLRRLHGEETTTQKVVNRLNATFVTPIDREDIHDLAFRLDDVTKAALTAAERFGIYQLSSNAVHERLADVLVACCKEMVAAVSKLGDTRRMVEVQQHCARIYQLQGEADEEMREVLRALYAEPVSTPADVVTLIKRRDVIDLQKRAIERCEWIADSLHNVAVKHA
jgi:uncharacterized protein Yka (UPF0111/DUF47 family)